MPKFRFYHYSKAKKRTLETTYDTDTAVFVCSVPNGRLLRMKKKCAFFIYNPRAKTKHDAITPVSYLEAKNLTKTHGTREQYLEYFTILNPDGSYKTGKKFKIEIDDLHRIKLQRTASLLGMSATSCVQYLIDKYDDMGHSNKSFSYHQRKPSPDPSQFTS